MAKQARLTLKDYRALAGIRRGMRQFLEFSAGAALAAGLTPGQHQALLAIKGMPEPVTVGSLAEWLGVKPHSAVGLVNRLAALKLLQRAVEWNAAHFLLLLELGRCQEALGLVGPARLSFTRALTVGLRILRAGSKFPSCGHLPNSIGGGSDERLPVLRRCLSPFRWRARR